MAFWTKKIGGGSDAAKAAEEAAEAEEERRKAEEERRRQEEAKARAEAAEEVRREREEQQRQAEEQRQAEAEERVDAATEPAQGAAPVIELEEQRIGPDVDPATLPPRERPAPDPADAPPPELMQRIGDIAIAQGSQQSMAEQGYGDALPAEPNVQRQALAQIAGAESRVAETPDALAAPNPEPAPPDALAPEPAPPQPGGPQATGVTSMAKPIMAPTPPPEEEPDPTLLQLQQAADQTQQQGDERENELAKAQRRDRILKAIRGLLGLGGIVGGTVAQIRGNTAGQIAGMGLQGVGRLVGSLGGYEEDTALRQRGARADEQMTAQQRAAAVRAGQYGRQLSQTDEAQRQRMTLAQQRRDDAMAAAQRDAARADELAPLEQAALRARAEREQARAERERARAESERTEAQLAIQAAEREASAPARRGGGGRRRSPAVEMPVTDTVRRRVAEEYPNASPAQRAAIERRVMEEEGADVILSTDARQASRERTEQQARASLPGFRLKEGERPPDDVSWRGLREGLVAYRDARRQLDEMQDILERSGVGDAAWSAIAATDDSAQYSIDRNAIMTALQKMSGGGVLTDGDVARLSALVPSFGEGSIRNGEANLRAMMRDMQASVQNRMDVYGYAPGSGGQSQGGGPSGGGDMVTVQTPDGGRREITREQYERLMERRRARQ